MTLSWPSGAAWATRSCCALPSLRPAAYLKQCFRRTDPGRRNPKMAYVPVPKDLTKVKTKVAFNLTKRQLVCFGSGALIGVPLFFLLRGPAGNSVAAMCMMLVMLPFFMLAMYEKHGQPLEKIVGNILKVAVIRPKQRPFKTNNFYAVLERQAKLDKEVYDIVHRKEKPAGR